MVRVVATSKGGGSSGYGFFLSFSACHTTAGGRPPQLQVGVCTAGKIGGPRRETRKPKEGAGSLWRAGYSRACATALPPTNNAQHAQQAQVLSPPGRGARIRRGDFAPGLRRVQAVGPPPRGDGPRAQRPKVPGPPDAGLRAQPRRAGLCPGPRRADDAPDGELPRRPGEGRRDRAAGRPPARPVPQQLVLPGVPADAHPPGGRPVRVVLPGRLRPGAGEGHVLDLRSRSATKRPGATPTRC